MNLRALFSRLPSIQSITGLGSNVAAALALPVTPSTANGLSVLDATGKLPADQLPESITVGSIAFGDGSAVILPSGTLSGGADGLLYQHNGTDTGGIPYAPQPRNTLKKVISIPAGRINGEVVNANCSGTITATGSLDTTFTSAATGVLTVPVAVVLGDTPYTWNRKVTAAWNANSTFAASYIAYSAAGLLQVQDKTANRVDATLSFTLANSTATGISPKTGSKVFQYAYIELGDFTIQASEAVAGTKFLLTGEVSITSTGTNAANFIGLWGSETFGTISSSVTSRVAITAGAGGVNNNHLRFKSPCLLVAGSGYYIAMAPATTGAAGFITETVLNGTTVQSVTNLIPAVLAGGTTAFNASGRKAKATLMLTCAIQLTATSTAQVGIDLSLVKDGW